MFYWSLPGQGDYYQPVFISEAGATPHEGYVADLITEKSINWMAEKRDTEKPFMLMTHHKATHRTWKPALRHEGLYDGIDLPVPPTLFDDHSGRGTAARGQDMTIAHDA